MESVELGESIELPADGGDVESDPSVWGRLVAAIAHELSVLGPPAAGHGCGRSPPTCRSAPASRRARRSRSPARLSLADAADWRADPTALAVACRNAEERPQVSRAGSWTSWSSCAGREGCALLIDCRTLETKAGSAPAANRPSSSCTPGRSGRSRRARTRSAAAPARRWRRSSASRRFGTRRSAQVARRSARPARGDRERAACSRRRARSRTATSTALGRLMTASHDEPPRRLPRLDAGARRPRRGARRGRRVRRAPDGRRIRRRRRRRLRRGRVGSRRRGRHGPLSRRTGLEPQAFTCRAVDGAGPLEAHPCVTRLTPCRSRVDSRLETHRRTDEEEQWLRTLRRSTVLVAALVGRRSRAHGSVRGTRLESDRRRDVPALRLLMVDGRR